jgi:predicted O-methyltransferase YrrM
VMFGTGLQYLLRRPFRVMAAVASDPWEAWATFNDRRVEYDWEHRLHRLIGVTWPREATADFWTLWHQVIGELDAKGIRTGPESFGGWNDGDAGLLRAIWCLIRHLRPTNVVETGVAHGLTSRFILEALEKNGFGHLWSIDKPPMEQTLREQIAIAVAGKHPDRWSLIEGSSSDHLPNLISELGQIDIFIHDSLHTEQNVRFELDGVWAALRPGGAIVVDDIDTNRAFRTFKQAIAGYEAMTCEAEPVRPDLRRFNNKGLFGIILRSRRLN